jgi:hypothetical protein
MSYPIVEARMSREQARQTLAGICERLEACSSATLENRYFRKGAPQIRTVQRLWVVGSYARGAGMGEDLDIVMELDVPHYRVSELNRVLLGNPQSVNLYAGTPEDNTSGVEFPEAYLIWESGKGSLELLDAISAGSAAERTAVSMPDALPMAA